MSIDTPAFIANFFDGWNSADVIALTITVVGLWLTYRKAAQAKSTSEATKTAVESEVARISKIVSSFEIFKTILEALALLTDIEEVAEREEWKIVPSKLGALRSLYDMILEDASPCFDAHRDQLGVAIKYCDKKIAEIIAQNEAQSVKESSARIRDVMQRHATLLKKIRRTIEMEQINDTSG